MLAYNNLVDEKWNVYEELFITIMNKTFEHLQINKDSDVSVVLVDSEYIKEINKSYRQIDKSTDVISFALNDDNTLISSEGELGDIFINVDAVLTQSNEYGHSIKREIGFLFAHGLLHLLGYDHQTVSDEEEMFKLQDLILEGIVSRNAI